MSIQPPADNRSRDVVILAAIRTRNQFGPYAEDQALVAATVAGRYWKSMGLTPVFPQTEKAWLNELDDNVRVYSLKDWESLVRGIEAIEAIHQERIARLRETAATASATRKARRAPAS